MMRAWGKEKRKKKGKERKLVQISTTGNGKSCTLLSKKTQCYHQQKNITIKYNE